MRWCQPYYNRKVDALTFINALELLPVHCLKLQPCGKRLSPRNGGASVILNVGEMWVMNGTGKGVRLTGGQCHLKRWLHRSCHVPKWDTLQPTSPSGPWRCPWWPGEGYQGQSCRRYLPKGMPMWMAWRITINKSIIRDESLLTGTSPMIPYWSHSMPVSAAYTSASASSCD